MSYADYKKNRLRPEERAALMTIDMLDRSFMDCINVLGNRLKDYKFLKRDIGMLRHTLTQLAFEAIKNVDLEESEVIKRQAKDYKLGMVRIQTAEKPLDTVMPPKDVWQFCHLVMSEHCRMCFMTPGECRACGVRKLLRRYSDEPEPISDNDCGFKYTDIDQEDSLGEQKGL